MIACFTMTGYPCPLQGEQMHKQTEKERSRQTAREEAYQILGVYAQVGVNANSGAACSHTLGQANVVRVEQERVVEIGNQSRQADGRRETTDQRKQRNG